MDDIVERLSYFVTNEVRMPAGEIITVIEEIERLQAIEQDKNAEIQRLQAENEQLRMKISQSQ